VLTRVSELALKIFGETKVGPYKNWDTYRWVSWKYPVETKKPGFAQCPTAGSYSRGQRVNAKGLHGALYTSPNPLVAAVEVALGPGKGAGERSAESVGSVESTALKAMRVDKYYLYELNVNLSNVALLSDLPDNLIEDLYRNYDHQAGIQNSCKSPHQDLSLSQEIGWLALLKGYEAILRPSAAYWFRWGSEAARNAPVLDILCPNITSEIKWNRIP